jgi:hypothetical protein
MRADAFLRELGQGLAGGMRRAGVPALLVDQWHQNWALMVADSAEDGEPVANVVCSAVQAMAMARDTVEIYGRR